MCGVTPSSALISKTGLEKTQVRPNDAVADITKEYLQNQMAFLGGIMAFIENAVGLDSAFAPDEHAADYYRNLLQRRIRHLLDLLSDPSYRSGELSGFFKNQRELMLKPMTSLRDVDEPGLIHLADRDDHKKKLDEAKVRTVMDFICNGTAEMGDAADGGA